jgi:pyrroloquinoline quinone biosynthesis protein B
MYKGRAQKAKIDRRAFLKSIVTASAVATLGWASAAGHSLAHGSLENVPEGEVTAFVLGSGQDGGVPHAGCRCAHCEAALQNPGLRRRSPLLALLHHGEHKVFLLDAGPDLKEQLYDLPAEWRKGRNPVDGIFLTHAHIGHYLGLAHLGREALGTERLPVYCSERMAAFLKNNGPWSQLLELENIELFVLSPNQEVSLSRDLTVRPIPVPHRAEFTDTFAFFVRGPRKSLLYLPDIDRWEQLQPPIEELLQGLDIALLDGTFYSSEELPGRDMSKIPHPPIAETAQRLADIVVGGKTQILFIHLNHSNLVLDADGARLKEIEKKGFRVAHDGMQFAL